MTLSEPMRKLALTAHVTTSVGWLGAVAAFLVLALAGITSGDEEVVRGVARTMETLGWFVLVPLAFASLATGLIQAFGTRWGLFRHYWVIAKLVISVFATTVLLLYMGTLGHYADVAAQPALTGAELDMLRSPSPVLHAALALFLLVVATTLAVFKPRGLTRYGRRRLQGGTNA